MTSFLPGCAKGADLNGLLDRRESGSTNRQPLKRVASFGLTCEDTGLCVVATDPVTTLTFLAIMSLPVLRNRYRVVSKPIGVVSG